MTCFIIQGFFEWIENVQFPFLYLAYYTYNELNEVVISSKAEIILYLASVISRESYYERVGPKHTWECVKAILVKYCSLVQPASSEYYDLQDF